MRYRVVHRTRYVYTDPVSASYGEHHLTPRSTPTQQVLEASVAIDPPASERHQRLDLFGNHAEYYSVLQEHQELIVTSSALVNVSAPVTVTVTTPWEQCRDGIWDAIDLASYEARPLALDSPQVASSPELLALAHTEFTPGRPIMDAYVGLVHRIFTEFDFDATATTVTTDVEEVLERRAGVCQDFAHVMIGCLRSLGLSARYVSGYLETIPPPGQAKLQGADASHAWVSLFVPGAGWVDADPTNDQLVGTRHITVGWGRDYGDVAPLKGVIYTDGPTKLLDVQVDVIRVDEEGADASP